MSDLISRQDAIDAIKAYLTFADWKPSVQRILEMSVNDTIDMLERLPSAQPERKRGKWIRHYCEDGNPDGWQCGQCAEWYYFGETKPNFCPNCGADMRGEVNG